MLWGENRGKRKGRQSLGIEPRTPLAWAASALPLSHDNRTTTSPHNPAQVGLSRMPGSHSVCAVRTPLGIDRKILSIRKEPIVSGFSQSNSNPKCGNRRPFHFPLFSPQNLFQCEASVLSNINQLVAYRKYHERSDQHLDLLCSHSCIDKEYSKCTGPHTENNEGHRDEQKLVFHVLKSHWIAIGAVEWALQLSGKENRVETNTG